MIASRTALRRSLLRFRKNDTVIGMMGHTQGVSIAKKPASSPSRKIIHHDMLISAVPVAPKAFSSSVTGAHSDTAALSAMWAA